jgi:hypothetical protein
VVVTYLYAERIVNTNQFLMAFSLSPAEANLTTTSFNSSNFDISLPIENEDIEYDPKAGIIYLSGIYLKSLEGNPYTLSVNFTNNEAFYAEPSYLDFTPTGINAQLVIEDLCSNNTILQYVIMA